MTASKLEIGTPIDSWCTGCKSDQPHVVATLKTDGTLNKVTCNACKAEHVYRKPKTAPPESEKKSGGGTKRRKKLEGAVSQTEAAQAKAYAMDGVYQSGDVIDHSRFGLGRVTVMKPGGKMEVAFSDITRVLVCRDIGLLVAKRSVRAPIIVKPVEVEVVAVEEEAIDDEVAETDEVAEIAEDE